MSNLRSMIENSSVVPLPSAPLTVCDKHSQMADAIGARGAPAVLVSMPIYNYRRYVAEEAHGDAPFQANHDD